MTLNGAQTAIQSLIYKLINNYMTKEQKVASINKVADKSPFTPQEREQYIEAMKQTDWYNK